MSALDDKLATWRRETEQVKPSPALLAKLEVLALEHSGPLRPRGRFSKPVTLWLLSLVVLGSGTAGLVHLLVGADEPVAAAVVPPTPPAATPVAITPAPVKSPAAAVAPTPLKWPPTAIAPSSPEAPLAQGKAGMPGATPKGVVPTSRAPALDEPPSPQPVAPPPSLFRGTISARVGSVAPEGTPWAEWIEGIKARVDSDTGGKLKLKIFMGGKIGGEKEMAEATRNGNLELFGGAVGSVAKYVPELNVLELPYIFTSDAEADFVLDKLRDPVAKLLEKKGFVLVMWAENGWHGYGVKGKCVEKVEDMKGLKMRSQESYVHIETYKAFGASPVEMAVPEVLGALQTGTIDGYSNTPLFSFATGWYNGITHYTYTKHIYQPAVMVISKKWFDQQPDDIKKALLVRTDERAGVEAVRALNEPLLDNFRAAGKTVCLLTPEAAKGYAAKVKPAWDEFAKKSPWNRLKLNAVLAAKREFAAR